jgi:hypothetical protein
MISNCHYRKPVAPSSFGLKFFVAMKSVLARFWARARSDLPAWNFSQIDALCVGIVQKGYCCRTAGDKFL